MEIINIRSIDGSFKFLRSNSRFDKSRVDIIRFIRGCIPKTAGYFNSSYGFYSYLKKL